jgi:hypothetical protein
MERYEQLKKLSDPQGLVPLWAVITGIEPTRKLASGREVAIKKSLRVWSNPRDHGNNSIDKGWIELGYLDA